MIAQWTSQSTASEFKALIKGLLYGLISKSSKKAAFAVEGMSDWVDRNGPIANADVCRIAGVDTLKASKMLRGWVERGLLEPLAGRVRSNAAYQEPAQEQEQMGLLNAISGEQPSA